MTPGDDPGFPVPITRAGSYRLSGNLRVTDPNTPVVLIAADNVTLDLNGFTIQGPREQCFNRIVPVWCPGDSAAADGVRALFSAGGRMHSNTVVVNGTVRGMVATGLVLGFNSRIERLHVAHNGGESGIVVFEGSIVSNSIVANNVESGIRGTAALVVGNVIHGNAQAGIVSSYYKDNLLFGNNAGLGQVFLGTDGGGNICEPCPCSSP